MLIGLAAKNAIPPVVQKSYSKDEYEKGKASRQMPRAGGKAGFRVCAPDPPPLVTSFANSFAVALPLWTARAGAGSVARLIGCMVVQQ